MAAHVFHGELIYGDGWQQSHPSIEDVTAINFPLNEFASSGLGQSGPLAVVISELQRVGKEARNADNDSKLERYRKRLAEFLDDIQ